MSNQATRNLSCLCCGKYLCGTNGATSNSEKKRFNATRPLNASFIVHGLLMPFIRDGVSVVPEFDVLRYIQTAISDSVIPASEKLLIAQIGPDTTNSLQNECAYILQSIFLLTEVAGSDQIRSDLNGLSQMRLSRIGHIDQARAHWETVEFENALLKASQNKRVCWYWRGSFTVEDADSMDIDVKHNNQLTSNNGESIAITSWDRCSLSLALTNAEKTWGACVNSSKRDLSRKKSGQNSGTPSSPLSVDIPNRRFGGNSAINQSHSGIISEIISIRGNYDNDSAAMPEILKFITSHLYPSDTLLMDLAHIRDFYPDHLTSIPHIMKYLMEHPDARTTPTVDVISEQARKELSNAITLIEKFNESEKKKSERLSAAAKAVSDGEDVLTDLEKFIAYDGSIFRSKCPLLFGIINRCELSVNDERFLNGFENEHGMYLYIRGNALDIDLANRTNQRRRASGSAHTNSDQPTQAERDILTLSVKNTQAELGVSHIIHSSSHGQTRTGWMDYFSLMATMGGLSGSVVGLWSKFGLLSSKTTAKKKLKDTSNKMMEHTKGEIAGYRNDNSTAIAHADNYNVISFNSSLKMKALEANLPKSTYTQISVSFSMLFKSFINEPESLMLKEDPNKPTTVPLITIESLKELKFIFASTFFAGIDPIMENIVDTSDARLHEFASLPSPAWASSSKNQLLQLFLAMFCRKELACDKKDMLACVDTEPGNAFAEFAIVVPESLIGIVTPIPVLHTQMGMQKMIYGDDPYFFGVIMVPFIVAMGFRPQAFKPMQKSHFERMNKSNSEQSRSYMELINRSIEESNENEHDAAAADGASNSSSSGRPKRTKTSSRQPNLPATEENKLLKLFRIIGTSMENDLIDKRKLFDAGSRAFKKQVLEEEAAIAAAVAATVASGDEDLANAYDDDNDVQPTSDPFDDDEDGEDDDDDDEDGEGGVENDSMPCTSSSEKKTKKEKQKMKFKTLNRFIEGLYAAWLTVKGPITAKYKDSTNPLIKYHLHAFDDLLEIAVASFSESVSEGKASNLYTDYPKFVLYAAWYGHPNLVKFGTYMCLNIQHWINFRSDILRFIARNTKWIYDGFIEFHNSVICGFLSKMRSSVFSSDKIREASQSAKLFQMCMNVGNKLIHSVVHSTAVGRTAAAVYSGVSLAASTLRKTYKGFSTASAATPQNEAAKVAGYWYEPKNKGELDRMAQYICRQFEHHDRLPSDAMSERDRELVRVWDSYRPLHIMSEYPEYPLSIFNTFRLNMIKREMQLRALERLPKYQRWLWLQTKETLYSIVRRFKNIHTAPAFRQYKIDFGIAGDQRFTMPSKLSGLRKSDYIELLCLRLYLIACCIAPQPPDNDEIRLKSDDDIINFIIEVCDIHIDGQHDQLRYHNDENIKKKLEGTPSRQTLWNQGMENQEAASDYFWRKFERNATER